ncbi:MAG TPA: sigma-70 family RNA polymerase sigma factor [Burkholderiaceae bacterium]|nr:sigma-70 family RNA polymerase sigma factor [Burkholderiaceae bacterium]
MALDDLATVFMAHRKALQWTAQKILGDRPTAEDLVQDAYLKAREAAQAGVLRDPVAFAHQVVRHLAIDRHRRRALEACLFTDEASGHQVAATMAGPEGQAIDRQALARVARALGELPARARQVFELYRLEGCTQREIAARFDISPALVNFIIRDALAHCRAALYPT